MAEQQIATVNSVTSSSDDLELEYRKFARHMNRLWTVRSLWVVAAVVGASIILPGQVSLWLALLLPAVTLATMTGLKAAARKKFSAAEGNLTGTAQSQTK